MKNLLVLTGLWMALVQAGSATAGAKKFEYNCVCKGENCDGEESIKMILEGKNIVWRGLKGKLDEEYKPHENNKDLVRFDVPVRSNDFGFDGLYLNKKLLAGKGNNWAQERYRGEGYASINFLCFALKK